MAPTNSFSWNSTSASSVFAFLGAFGEVIHNLGQFFGAGDLGDTLNVLTDGCGLRLRLLALAQVLLPQRAEIG